ncbi:hypothetical protein FE634_02670 [Nocardioides dongxiaopingii]|uniref:hypothetical protein n=1 Tax=Nocardioides sp. S-1144 TaxID=2582905 RepID=UPI00110EA96D|nr:hypothetical protein [Nocardioides sp. S-1144]QCW49589.1 hypothetical protein FE634_02670 [Nocardioides sp. S-1144]
MVDLERTRDLFMVAAIFGTFGFAWAGWAQEAPPPRLRPLLGALGAASLLVGVAGGLLAWQGWDEPSSFSGADDGVRFGIVVGIEVVLCLVGSAVLAARRRAGLIAAWVSLVVGVHFVPLVFLFDNLTLLAPAAAMVVSAVVAWRRSPAAGSPDGGGAMAASAVTGLVNAPVLLLTAALNLVLGLTSS